MNLLFLSLLFSLPAAVLLRSRTRTLRKKIKQQRKKTRREKSYNTWCSFFEDTDKALPPPPFTITSNHDKCAVIVETRKHKHLSYTLRNTMHFLGEEWSLCIFHGDDNEEYVKNCVEGWGDILDIPGYNTLLTTPAFWEQIPGKTILIFQTDSLLRRKGTDEFLDYDYIGAPLSKSIVSRRVSKSLFSRVGTTFFIGNGGLSLRNKEAMIAITKKHPHNTQGEDVFFSKYGYEEGYSMPRFKKAESFCSQTWYSRNPLGLHSPYGEMSSRTLKKLLSTIDYNS